MDDKSKSSRIFNVRPYQDEDADRAVHLFRTCFSQERDRLEWIWKFERQLTNGDRPLFHVAEVEGQLVAMYPMRALRLQFGGIERVAAFIQDVCVHPDYRGGSILRAIHQANVASWLDSGIPFSFGFATPGHTKFGVRFMGYIELFRVPVWRRRLARGLRLQARLSSDWIRRAVYASSAVVQDMIDQRWFQSRQTDIRIIELSRFECSSVNQLWSRLRCGVRFGVVRDADYLTWRYLERPGVSFRILGATRGGSLDGYCVFRDDYQLPGHGRIGVVMDLVAVDLEAARCLLDQVLTRMRRAYCGYALALCHPAMAEAPALSASGFVPYPHLDEVIVCVSHVQGINLEALRRPSDWLLSFGDSEGMG